MSYDKIRINSLCLWFIFRFFFLSIFINQQWVNVHNIYGGFGWATNKTFSIFGTLLLLQKITRNGIFFVGVVFSLAQFSSKKYLKNPFLLFFKTLLE